MMTSRLKIVLPAVALTVACSLGAFGLGVFAGGGTATPDEGSALSGAAVQALTTSGDTVQLTSSQEDVYDENSAPLEPEDATFESNVNLTEDEAEDRSVEVGESYDLGEPVTPEDLEFLRIYAFSAEEPAAPQLASAELSSGEGPTIELASTTTTTPFNVTKSGFGTTANATGSMKLTIGDTITNSWSVSWTAKRLSGLSTTKIVAKANIFGYGAVAAWPFVGLVYEAHPTASTTTSQSLGFARSATFSAFLIYMTGECKSTFYNSTGSFQI